MSALIVADLISRKKDSILAIDADPNSCLAEALGAGSPQTIVGICEEVSKMMDRIPAGMTKERFIEMRVQSSLVENKDFDLLVMGRPEGPGCYCYVNNLLRNMVDRITSNYDFVVIDNAAGMEHISRRTMRGMGRLVLVSDYSIPGVRSARKIYELAKDLGIKIDRACLVVNKSSGAAAALDAEIRKTGLELIGEIPYSDDVVAWNISNAPIFEFANGVIKYKVAGIVEKLL